MTLEAPRPLVPNRFREFYTTAEVSGGLESKVWWKPVAATDSAVAPKRRHSTLGLVHPFLETHYDRSGLVGVRTAYFAPWRYADKCQLV